MPGSKAAVELALTRIILPEVAVHAIRELQVADAGSEAPQPLFAWQHQIEVAGSRFGAPTDEPTLHDWGPLVVPAGTFFMMGDNRDDSVDSRYYGPVPRQNVRGTPAFVYYSYDPEEGLPYVRALTEIRWRRLGKFRIR